MSFAFHLGMLTPTAHNERMLVTVAIVTAALVFVRERAPASPQGPYPHAHMAPSTAGETHATNEPMLTTRRPTQIGAIREALFATPAPRWPRYQELINLSQDIDARSEAIELLLDLIDTFPERTEPREALGRIYMENGNYDLAIPYLETVLNQS